MIVISDTGPIIGLSKIDKIFLLKKIAKEILIPPMVQKELFGKTGPESEIIDKALTDFINVKECGILDANTEMALAGLGEGEKQAIGLACNINKKVLLLLDDRAGRGIAKNLNIPTIGLIGLLLISKEKGIINNISPLLYELRNNGYWLSDDVIKIAKKLSGE